MPRGLNFGTTTRAVVVLSSLLTTATTDDLSNCSSFVVDSALVVASSELVGSPLAVVEDYDEQQHDAALEDPTSGVAILFALMLEWTRPIRSVSMFAVRNARVDIAGGFNALTAVFSVPSPDTMEAVIRPDVTSPFGSLVTGSTENLQAHNSP